jgi:hypothetical protein
MRFIGNNHALHFGGVTFVNRATLLKEVHEEMEQYHFDAEMRDKVSAIIKAVVDQIEDELRQELKAKHYHHDLHVPEGQ